MHLIGFAILDKQTETACYLNDNHLGYGLLALSYNCIDHYTLTLYILIIYAPHFTWMALLRNIIKHLSLITKVICCPPSFIN